MGDTNGIRVFVYGTLKQGNGNYRHYLQQSELLGRCALVGKHTMVDLGAFPGVINYGEESKAPEKTVYGEVYRVTSDVLGALDLLEGNGSFYTREKVWTPWKKAWCYYLPKEYYKENTEVISGSWNTSAPEQSWIDAGAVQAGDGDGAEGEATASDGGGATDA
jgi:gamma-glutamylcyclotransferase (GGCT)/AIG2-like uncharacterized protein YtfP